MSLINYLFSGVFFDKISSIFSPTHVTRQPLDGFAGCFDCDGSGELDYYDYDVDSFL